jgi:hypothetical protein
VKSVVEFLRLRLLRCAFPFNILCRLSGGEEFRCGIAPGDAAALTVGIAHGTAGSVTLTLELSDLRIANEKALAQLSRTTEPHP